MSQWNNSTTNQRLNWWIQFRDSLRDLEFSEQLTSVARYFRSWPHGTRSVDYYDSNSWPTPWEILHHGLYCRNTAAILMHDTLRIINNHADLKLVLVDDLGEVYLALLVEKHCILNIVLGEVSSLASLNAVNIINHFRDGPDRAF